MSTPPTTASSPTLLATASNWHRAKLLAVSLLFLGFGIACIIHGFAKYPADNAKHARDFGADAKPPHSDLDINLNRFLGIVLPPLGLLMIIRTLYMSRGQYRLADDVLSAPGHPDVPLSSIVRIDKRRWDRKGIVKIEYRPAGTDQTRTIRLDDFYYDRANTDAILAHVEAYVRRLAAAAGGDDAGRPQT